MSAITVIVTDDDIASGRADEILLGALKEVFPEAEES